MIIIKPLLYTDLLVYKQRLVRRWKNVQNNEQWIDYIDGGCDVLKVDYQFFKKELSLDIQVFDENNNKYTHNILFQNVASVYFNAGDGNIRLEKIIPEELVITRKESESCQIL
ncbi:hypothetical protein BSF_38880 [Bacillus subtilis]|nr:hypothetical protein BSF_38880 [Bacillus subtilis]